MQISIANAIQVARRIGSAASIITNGLKMWLGFKTSEPLGREEVVNGDFATDLSGWSFAGTDATNTITWNNGRVEMIADGSTQLNLSQDVFEVGKTYKIELDAYNVTGAGFKAFDSGLMFTIQSDKHYEFYHTALSTSLKIYRNTSGSSSSGELDNISVKEFPQFVKDKSPNTNNATLFTGKALDFNGSGDSVDCGDVGANKTLAFWFNPTTDITSSTGPQRLFGFNTNFHGVSLGSVAGDLTGETLTIVPDASSRTATTMNFQAGIWYRVVVIWNATNSYYDIYVNGELKTDLVFGTHTLIDWSNFLMGEVPAGTGSNFDGKLSNVQIYNAVWSADDIAYDYAKPNHLVTDNPSTSLTVTNLKAYWALSEGDGLVAYDSGTNLEQDVVQNGDFSELGSEEVTDGIFSNGLDDWNQNGNFTSVNNQLICSTSDAGLLIYQNPITPYVDGKAYEYTFDVVSITTGNVRARLGNTLSDAISTEGTHSVVIIHSGTTPTYFVNYGSDAVIDNISVKQVDPNDEWTLGTGWSYGNDKVISDGTATAVQQNGLLTIDSTYQITATVTGNPSLLVFNSSVFYNDLASRTLSNGTNTYILKAKAINFAITNAGGDSCDVTNISVTEITPSDHGGLVIGATYTENEPRIPQLGMVDWAIGSNLYLNSEPTSNEGVAGNITYGSYSWGLNGFSNATIYGDSSVTRYRYGATVLQNTEYTLSCYVIMDDLTEPNVGNNTASGDFCIIIGGVQTTLNATSVNVSGDIWRISRTITTGTTSLASNGITKYSSQSDKGFKVVGWQIEQSATAGNYILTDRAAAIDVTTIQNPSNKGYDIFGNPLRLREHAFNLDGSGYAEIADSDSLDLVGTDFTLESWVKIDNYNSFNTIFGKDYTTGYHLSSNINNGYINFWVGNVNSKSTSSIGLNVWKHIVVTKAGSLIKYYIDGSHLTGEDDTNTGVVANNTKELLIGSDYEGLNKAHKFEGLIDEPRIYNRALTQEEITQNYNVGLPAHTNPSSYSGDYSSDYGF